MAGVILNAMLGIFNLYFFIKIDSSSSYINLLIAALCIYAAFKTAGDLDDNKE